MYFYILNNIGGDVNFSGKMSFFLSLLKVECLRDMYGKLSKKLYEFGV